MHRTHASAQINKSEQTGMQAHRFQFSTYYIDIQPNCEYRINEQHVFFCFIFLVVFSIQSYNSNFTNSLKNMIARSIYIMLRLCNT